MRLSDFLALSVVCTIFALVLHIEGGIKNTWAIVFFFILLAVTCSTLNYLNHGKLFPVVFKKQSD
ncbi:MAG: hypothetical protein PHT40_01150 [Patescibacteria group bacterium]|nr:hypothetical protein [Patescibacteria group bacterium]